MGYQSERSLAGTQAALQVYKRIQGTLLSIQPERIHFIHQSIFLLTHIASETARIGPPSCYAQWTIETAISISWQGNPSRL
jgi:hypothetical protein